MGWQFPNEVAKIGPVLWKYNIGPNEWSILHTIASGENETKRNLVLSGKVDPNSVQGLEAGCWTSAKTLGENWNLGERTVIRHLKTLRECGLIRQARNSADKDDTRVFRFVNRDKITQLVGLLPPPKKRKGEAEEVEQSEVESTYPEQNNNRADFLVEEDNIL